MPKHPTIQGSWNPTDKLINRLDFTLKGDKLTYTGMKKEIPEREAQEILQTIRTAINNFLAYPKVESGDTKIYKIDYT